MSASRAQLLPEGSEGDGDGVESLAAYEARGGYVALRTAREQSGDEVLTAVEQSNLGGRGGAGFATARKWRLARDAVSDVRYVVANGGEHEPGSLKDRWLLARHPHLVLEGIALCALATGAREAYVYVIEDMQDAIASVREAIATAVQHRLLEGLEVHVVTAPTVYVAGEETAALEVIEGRKAWPRKKPPYPGTSGLFGKPTTVNNVETLACVPAIVRLGAEAYGAGTMLFTLDASVKRPGVYELPMGTSFRTLIEDRGGGTLGGRAVKAILPALSSPFLPGSAIDLAMDPTAVRAAGSSLGCGGVSVIEEGTCVIERLLTITQFFMREQCGQCPPCRMETNTLAAVIKQVAAGTTNDYRAQIEKITAFAKGKGNCSLIEMAAAPVLSALRLFAGDFEVHARTGACTP